MLDNRPLIEREEEESSNVDVPSTGEKRKRSVSKSDGMRRSERLKRRTSKPPYNEGNIWKALRKGRFRRSMYKGDVRCKLLGLESGVVRFGAFYVGAIALAVSESTRKAEHNK